VTVAELAGRYLREHVEVRCQESTQRMYRSVVERFIAPPTAIWRLILGDNISDESSFRIGRKAKAHLALLPRPEVLKSLGQHVPEHLPGRRSPFPGSRRRDSDQDLGYEVRTWWGDHEIRALEFLGRLGHDRKFPKTIRDTRTGLIQEVSHPRREGSSG